VATILREEFSELGHEAVDRVKLYGWTLIPAKVISASGCMQNIELEERRCERKSQFPDQ
jgi:hypothetical protein